MPYRKSDTNPFGCGRSVLANQPCTAADEQAGELSRDKLEKMNARFVERVERAIASGEECAPAKRL